MSTNPQVKEEITMDIRNYFELNYHKSTAYQNLRNASNAVLSKVFTDIQAYLEKKDER